MANLVFQHVTGKTAFGIAVGVKTEVYSDTTGGKTPPQSLSVKIVAPAGQSGEITNVANGQTVTVPVSGQVNVEAVINNCRQEGNGTLFVFQVTLRAEAPLPVVGIPIKLQIDAFDVPVATDSAKHAGMLAAAQA
jgi:hypothetical protein